MFSLCNMKKNKIYHIVGYAADLPPKILRRLCDLGLTIGQEVSIEAKSLLKKALLLSVRGYLLSLKSDIAKGVKVQ